MRTRGFTRTAAIAAALILTTHGRADVLVLDASGGGDYTVLQDAIDGAVDGDVILARSGTYGSGGIGDLDIALVADRGAVVETGNIVVVGLSPSKTVLVADLDVVLAVAGPGIHLVDCAGSVRVQGCTVRHPDPGPIPGALVRECADVVFSGCDLRGADGVNGMNYSNGGEGLTSVDSSVALYDDFLEGGMGGFGPTFDCSTMPGYATPGAAGCIVAGGFLFAMGTFSQGGQGATTDCCPTYNGAEAGGEGMRLGSGSTVEIAASRVVGGPGGPGSCPEYPPGPTGENYAGGRPHFLDLGRRWLVAPTIVIERSVHQVEVHGLPGDRVFLPTTRYTDFLFRESASGVWTLRYPVMMPIEPLGTIDASGVLTLDIPVPNLPQGVPSQTLFRQLYVIDATGRPVLGTPNALVTLPRGF